MNGRVYDPFLGRMLSADPTVPGPFNSQAFNRYSYVLNNPLALTDPNGFTPRKVWDGAGGSDFGMRLPQQPCDPAGCGISPWRRRNDPSVPPLPPASAPTGFSGTRFLTTVWTEVNTSQSVVAIVNIIERDGSITPALITAMNGYSGAIVYGLVEGPLGSGAITSLSQVLLITGHNVGRFGPVHTAIENTSGASDTVSAGSENGALEGDLNRSSDEASDNYIIGLLLPPPGTSAQTYFSQLQTSTVNCCGGIGYDLFPSIGNGFNSNSFIFGLIGSSGGITNVSGSVFVGGGVPLPPQSFGPHP